MRRMGSLCTRTVSIRGRSFSIYMYSSMLRLEEVLRVVLSGLVVIGLESPASGLTVATRGQPRSLQFIWPTWKRTL